MKPKVIRKTVLGGGASLLGLLSLTGVGFSNWVLVKSNADISNIEVSVGENGVFVYNFDEDATWADPSYPDYSETYGFYNKEEKTFSSNCTLKYSVTIDIRDDDPNDANYDFYDYYHSYLKDPTTLSFYTRLEKTTTATTNLVDLSTNCNANITYSYLLTNSSTPITSTNLTVESVTDYPDEASKIVRKLTFTLPTSTTGAIDKWSSLTFTMIYNLNYETEVSAAIGGDSTSLKNIYTELEATSFTSSLFLEGSYA